MTVTRRRLPRCRRSVGSCRRSGRLERAQGQLGLGGNCRRGTSGHRARFWPAGSAGLGRGPDGAGAGPGGVTRSRSLNLWLRSPEPGVGEPAASPSTMAARWSRASRSVVMMSESTASEPARILSRTASIPCVNRAIGSRPTIAAAPLRYGPRGRSCPGARGLPGAAPGPSALPPG